MSTIYTEKTPIPHMAARSYIHLLLYNVVKIRLESLTIIMMIIRDRLLLTGRVGATNRELFTRTQKGGGKSFSHDEGGGG